MSAVLSAGYWAGM
jgi:hypothetical protein